MEKITTYNYEAFYLDYLEGNLDESGVTMLFDFLNQHPDLKAELEMEDDVLEFTLNSDSDGLTKFEKEDLKHFDCKANEICLNNVNDFIVADLENEISAEKKNQLDSFVIEHDLQESRDYFYASKLKADLQEVYPDKRELKKKGTVIPMFIKVASIAAVGLLVFNLVGSGNKNEIYTPRNSEFALQVDTTEHNFEINTNTEDDEKNNFAVSNSGFNKNTVNDNIENQSDPKDSILIPVFDFIPNNDFVEDKKEDKEIKEEKIITPLVPVPEDFKDDVALVSTSIKSKEEINLVDMYKPITNLTNSYTNLGVSYKKSQPESEYAVTAFSIGKFSFERKKRK